MSFIRFLFSKSFYLNLFIAILLLIGIIWGTLCWLDAYTNHGESKALPDFRGTSVELLSEEFKKHKLRYQILDTIVSDAHPKGTVIEQTPHPYTLVKDNRTIYLTVNSVNDALVPFPNLNSGSPKMAIKKLKNIGLELDSILEVPGKYNNLVIDQLIDSESIEPGTMVKKGTKVVIKVSKTDMEAKWVLLPDFKGLDSSEAKEKALLTGLEISPLICPDCLTELDSMSATVVKQIPAYEVNKSVKQGTFIDLIYEPQ